MNSPGTFPVIGLLLASHAPLHSKWEYVWEQIFQMLGIRFVPAGSGEMPEIIIQYGDTEQVIPENRFVIRIPETVKDGRVHDASPNSTMKFISKKPNAGLPTACFSLFEKPMTLHGEVWLQAESEELIAVTVNERSIHCPIDIPATIFYFLNLGNEFRVRQRDEHGRFRMAFNPLDPGIYQVAVVDRLIRLLRAMLENAAGRKIPSRWPKRKTFAVALSHDVDKFRNWTWAKIKRGLQGARFPRTYLDMATALARPGNFSGNFKYIHEVESRLGAASTFFFVSKARSSRDPVYGLQDPRIKKQLHLLNSIGLHGSYTGASNPGYAVQEKTVLERMTNQTVRGIRSHYLMFDQTRTFRLFSDSGFEYDSTLGFPEAAGWRCGTGFPFQPWQGTRKSALPIYEMPLVMMDTSYFSYGKLSAGEAWINMLKILDETEANGSCLVVNWHSNNLHPVDPTGYSRLYWQLIEEAAGRNAWLPDMDSCISWWKNRSGI